MKKIVVSLVIISAMFFSGAVFATNDVNSINNRGNSIGIENSQAEQLINDMEKEINSLEEYKEAYGSDSYGLTAFLLNKIRIFSIPFCFLGIAFSAIYQYVLGIRKLDVRDKGFGVMLSIITIFVICQILPLIFAIVVKGWRG